MKSGWTKIVIASGSVWVGLVVVPATAAFAAPGITVPCSGSGGGSAGLIAAINAANVSGGTINLASGCTYLLTTFNNSPPGIGPNGLPIVTAKVAINGNGSTIARSGAAGTAKFRILAVVGDLSAQDLTLTGGANAIGGGLALRGSVTLNHSVVTGNSVTGVDAPGGPGGGGIFNAGGTLTLNNSQVNGNSAGVAAGGGIVNAGGTVVLNSSQVDGNSAGAGGGIVSGNGNGSVGGGGSLTLNRSEVDNNTVTSDFAAAGGIANGGTAILNSSEVDGNVLSGTGAVGGGIFNHGALTINKSNVDNNSATSEGTGGGGGIANANAAVANGGTEVPGTGVLTINNSEVNTNSTDGVGGGILNFQQDPSFTLQLTINHGQMNTNSAGSGGAIFTDNPATVSLATTSFSANAPDNCEPFGLIPGCAG